MKDDKNHIARKRLIEAMDSMNLNASELSKLSGVNRSSISQYRSGLYTPSSISADAMAEVLRVNPVWLMGLDAPKHFNVSCMPEIEKNIAKNPKRAKEILDILIDMDDVSYAALIIIAKRIKGQ